jgi:acetoacetyl-CoA synthetase
MSVAGVQKVSRGDFPTGAKIWEPSEDRIQRSKLFDYVRWLGTNRHLQFQDYEGLWKWSVSEIENFWATISSYFTVFPERSPQDVLTERRMPGAHWFPGAIANFAQEALSRSGSDDALVSYSEARGFATLTSAQLRALVMAAATGLRTLGVKRGDRVVAYMPNVPETVIAFLASASLGAIWSCCSQDAGPRAVLDRFQQIEPTVLIAADGYRYGGRDFDRLDVVSEIAAALPSLRAVVVVPNLSNKPRLANGAVDWDALCRFDADPGFEVVPFDHPLWILFTSGTTGAPKPIVHSHGGIVLEKLKAHSLHLDLKETDRFFWFGSPSWAVWNEAVCGLLLGATVLIYDGNPRYPDMSALWHFVHDTRATFFGASAPYFLACMQAGLSPKRNLDLDALRTIGSTGAPLTPDGFRWIYQHVKRDVLLGPMSGGTDVCTSFVGPNPMLPVYVGEMQCRWLGAAVRSYDSDGHEIVDQLGELVVTEPMPSMPLRFWNDPGDARYRETYFEHFRGVWRHGDWIKVTGRGTCVITGRSDATLKVSGVRMGTSEFYAVLDTIGEIADTLLVSVNTPSGDKLLLFVVPAAGVVLNASLKDKIIATLRQQLSPRHRPDLILELREVPRTFNGKKLEVPITRLLAGMPFDRASLGSAGSLDAIVELVDAVRHAGIPVSVTIPPRPSTRQRASTDKEL